ncbi:hypothetical protein FSARC_10942 [Fusarium sarcochroum]|uniref:Cellulose-binding protein n=1 Tax=Fusarium sarcochroum TaxID=1208366 RepID=A0A8H4TJ16_9HYPO|nr:hypothetical protein FSARC_10942 [Fusarium sarcochroum]
MSLSLSLMKLIAITAVASGTISQASSQCKLESSVKPRLFVLTDIANEPDDAQSLVRLMTYAHEFRIQGLIATTSIWLNDTTRADQILDIIDAYEQVLPNLQVHASGWPKPSHIRSIVGSGLPLYGMDGVGQGKDSEGSRLLIQAVDAASASDEPIYIPIWGGASVLAQALWYVNATRTSSEIQHFVSQIRAYAISDQDNTGVWIRRNWPQLFYIASIHHFNRYAIAAWGGMAGDAYYHFPSHKASKAVISPDWIKKNIQDVGVLGSRYPDADFIFEGDTPSFLYMIPNGLSDPEHPEWGSWGGRYGPVNYGEGHYADSVDTITHQDGTISMGQHVTVWRWREAFQNDFAARMQWSVTNEFTGAQHPPITVVNEDRSRSVIKRLATPGETIVLDASNSCDPDGEDEGLTYKWWQYKEPSSNNNNPKRDVATLQLDAADTARVTVTIPSSEELRRVGRNTHPEEDKHLHLILEVSDGKLTSYRRVTFSVLAVGSEIRHDEL